MADTKQAAAKAAEREVRYVFPLSGPPLPERKFSFTDSQRGDIRRLVPRRLSDAEFASFVHELEYQSKLHWALKARLRVPDSAIKATLLIERKRITGVRKALKHLRDTEDLADYLRNFVQQPFTEEQYWQSVVRAGTLPEKGAPINAKPDDENFKQELQKALELAHVQAAAEGRTTLRKVSIEDLLDAADDSLSKIDEILGRALALLTSMPRKGGRPRDVWRESLVTRLADVYAKYFRQEPTATADNDFHRLVDVAFNAVDWPQSDRRRLILAALKQRRGAKT
jgi:hypothetical protein